MYVENALKVMIGCSKWYKFDEWTLSSDKKCHLGSCHIDICKWNLDQNFERLFSSATNGVDQILRGILTANRWPQLAGNISL